MIYDRIINLCKQHDIKITTLLKELKIAAGSSTNWKNDKTPNSDALIKLSKYFNVSIDYILFGKEPTIPTEYQSLISSYQELSKDNQQLLKDIISSMIDIQNANNKRSEIEYTTVRHCLYKVSAGFGEALDDEDNWEDIEVVSTFESKSATYALTVDGDSMKPDFSDGDIVLVKEQPAVDIGEICIYIIEGKGYIKKYGGDRLISLNDKYDDIMFSNYNIDDIRCCGLVLGIAEQVE